MLVSVLVLVLVSVVVSMLASMVLPRAFARPAGAAVVGDDPFDCDARIVDTSGQLDVGAVAAAIEAQDGALVVVRGFDSVPDGDLVAVIDDLLADCFVDTADGLLPTLALFAFSFEDREADVFLGQALPGDRAAELRETMTATFAEGGFTEGVLDAIDELEALVAAGGPVAADDDSGGTEGAEPSGSPWLVAGGLGGAAALGGGAAAALAVSRRRKLIERRNRATAAMAEPRVRLGSLRERGQRVEAQAEVWARITMGRTLETLEQQRQRVRRAGTESESAAALLSKATPKGVARASNAELETAMVRLRELEVVLDANQAELDALVALGARLEHLRVALPTKRELLFGELAAAESLADKRHGEGWRVEEAEASLAWIRSELEGTDLNDLALDLLALSERVEATEAALFAVDHDLQSLPDRPGALIAWREKQIQVAQMEERRAEESIQRLARTTTDHAPESWNWAAGNPDRALAHLRSADEVAEQAMTLARSEQRFDDAGRALEEAGLELIAADELLDQVDDLLVDLSQARLEAPGILAEAREILAQFNGLVARHGADLEPRLVASPAQLDEALDGLELELASPRPNHLRAAQTGDRINRELDALIAAAEAQHEQMEALRRQAEREAARANRALLRTREAIGWELFSSDDSRILDALELRLGSLPSDPRQRAEEADAVADAALALQERIIARRRRQGNWVIVGGGTGGWSSGGGGGGGGGRTFGGGGGGGRSFGGGRSSGGW